MELIVTSEGKLHVGDRVFRCAVGKGGFRADKVEGDGATPVGSFRLKRVFYRGDRLQRPMTRLPVQEIHEDDGWCDDTDDPAYNTLIKCPFKARHEAMWRDDNLYDVVIEISHNDDPPIPGDGSAIFIHIAKPNYEATQGCIALAQSDLLKILETASTDTRIVIGPDAGPVES